MSVDIKDATELFKLAIKSTPENSFKTALEKVDGINTNITLKIPFEEIAGKKNEEVMPYVKEFGLDDPEKFIKFLVELHFACFDSINDGVSGIRKDILNSEIAKINNVRDLIAYATNNPDSEEDKLNECVTILSGVINDLELKINTAIGEIEAVDNRNAFSFFIKAKVDISKIDATVQRASSAMNAYFEALFLFSIVGTKLKSDITSYHDKAENYIKSLSEKGSISLMLAYERNKTNSIWDSKEFNNRLEEVRSVTKGLHDYLEEVEIDLEEIKF